MRALRRGTIPSTGKEMEKLESPYTASGDIMWHSPFRRQLGSPSKSKKLSYHTIQAILLHS